MKTPPFPEPVCAIAFADSSDTQVMRTSRAGQPASSSATNLRASGTDAGVPRNVRAEGRAGWAGPANPKEPTRSTG